MNSAINRILPIGLLLFCGLTFIGISGAEAAAQTGGYAHGNGALEVFDEEGQANAPSWVQAWILVMSLSFAIGLIFVWKRVEARWAVGGFIGTILAAIVLTPAFGLTELSGLFSLYHLIFWSPALYLLLKNRPFLGEKSAYKYWSGLITAVILFSFLFDIPDAAIYLDHMMGLGLIS